MVACLHACQSRKEQKAVKGKTTLKQLLYIETHRLFLRILSVTTHTHYQIKQAVHTEMLVWLFICQWKWNANGAVCCLISLTPCIHHSQSCDLHPTDSTIRWFVSKDMFSESGWTEFHLRGQTEGDAATLERGTFASGSAWPLENVFVSMCSFISLFFSPPDFFQRNSWWLREGIFVNGQPLTAFESVKVA